MLCRQHASWKISTFFHQLSRTMVSNGSHIWPPAGQSNGEQQVAPTQLAVAE